MNVVLLRVKPSEGEKRKKWFSYLIIFPEKVKVTLYISLHLKGKAAEGTISDELRGLPKKEYPKE